MIGFFYFAINADAEDGGLRKFILSLMDMGVSINRATGNIWQTKRTGANRQYWFTVAVIVISTLWSLQKEIINSYLIKHISNKAFSK